MAELPPNGNPGDETGKSSSGNHRGLPSKPLVVTTALVIVAAAAIAGIIAVIVVSTTDPKAFYDFKKIRMSDLADDPEFCKEVQSCASAAAAASTYSPRTRVYYIAAEEHVWDYAPSGINMMNGANFTDEQLVFVERSVNRIGSAYWKARYIQYTDATFTTVVPRTARSEHLGYLGPLIRAVVGDTIEGHFKNAATIPCSIHPHGVFYTKSSEGVPYSDGTNTLQPGGHVAPGDTYVYSWKVPARAGPGPRDESSTIWLYHSHTHEVADTFAGLLGAIIITTAAMANEDGTPKDVDREFWVQYMVGDENQSPFLERSAADFTNWTLAQYSLDDEEFHESNMMHNINGYVYGNLPGLVMNRGETVRWYVTGFGNEVDLHTPHWHGQTLIDHGRAVDVVSLLPATMLTLDMYPDNPGRWMFHCHVSDHIVAGMMSTFVVN